MNAKAVAIKHNKKRNSGLLQEFLARYVASAILDSRDQDLARAKALLKSSFRSGTELSKEAGVFESLYQGRGKFRTREGAGRLLDRSRQACGLQDQTKLDMEKTKLLNELQRLPHSDRLFGHQIRDYKQHVTIQVLLNHWRAQETKNPLLEITNLGDVAQLEDQLLEYLTTPGHGGSGQAASKTLTETLDMTPGDVDHLVVKILQNKLDRKYGEFLPEQKRLVNLWVFRDSDQKTLSETLVKIRNSTIGLIEWSCQNEPSLGGGLIDRLGEVRKLLEGKFSPKKLEDVSGLSDQDIGFFMEVCELRSELLGTNSLRGPNGNNGTGAVVVAGPGYVGSTTTTTTTTRGERA